MERYEGQHNSIQDSKGPGTCMGEEQKLLEGKRIHWSDLDRFDL